MVTFNKKPCQFCGEDIKGTSFYCHQCNHVQKDKALAYERLFRIQALRYGAMVIGIVLPFSTLGFYLGELELPVMMISKTGQLVFICLIGFPLLSLLFSLLPESSFKDAKVPYLLERIEYARKAMIRNWIIFPAIAALLVFAQIKLANNKPSLKDFRAYLKTNYAYTEKGILHEGECPLFTYHIVAGKDDAKVFVGMYNDFFSFDPSVFREISK